MGSASAVSRCTRTVSAPELPLRPSGSHRARRSRPSASAVYVAAWVRLAQVSPGEAGAPENGTPSTYRLPWSSPGTRRSIEAEGYQAPRVHRHCPSVRTPPPRSATPETVSRYSAPGSVALLVHTPSASAGTVTVSATRPYPRGAVPVAAGAGTSEGYDGRARDTSVPRRETTTTSDPAASRRWLTTRRRSGLDAVAVNAAV